MPVLIEQLALRMDAKAQIKMMSKEEGIWLNAYEMVAPIFDLTRVDAKKLFDELVADGVDKVEAIKEFPYRLRPFSAKIKGSGSSSSACGSEERTGSLKNILEVRT